MAETSTRMPLVDALKAVACVFIVWHHLAFYGPMSDLARPLAPGLIDWLYEYARMAVQVFLVVGGFLAAASLAPDGQPRVDHPFRRIVRRYWRLATPCMAALTLAIVCSALARQLMTHDSISASPGLAQLLAHMLLLQHLLGYEALSAGIWYVAIDFQLHALAIGLLLFANALCAHGPRWRAAAPATATLLTAASLFAFNLDERLDDTALYFLGAYGLGMLAWWAGRSARPELWVAGIASLGICALLFAYRDRIVVALVTALLLAWTPRVSRAAATALPTWLDWLATRSFAIFLVHFPVGLVVSGVFVRLQPEQPWAGAIGMLIAFGAALLVAEPFYRKVEAPGTGRMNLWVHATFLTTGIAAMLAGV